jgi:phospholipid/cholesterol/gamma-HCH transport system substrate-binding protein
MSRYMTPFRVGIMVLLGAGAFLVLASFAARDTYPDRKIYRVHGLFKDASGLSPKSAVQIAGIDVGVVDKITLTDDAHALVVIKIKKEIVLHTDARITKRSKSLLGDFILDVFPGTAGTPALHDGDAVGKVVNQPGAEDVFAALADVTRDIQGVTQSLKDLLSSDQVGSIKDIIRSMNEVAAGLNKTITTAGGRLDAILGDAQALSGSIRHLADTQGGNVNDILANVKAFTEQANKVVNGINQIVGGNGEDIRESVAGIKDTLAQLQATLKDADAMIGSAKGTVDDARKIVNQVNAGEGTVGKLLKDDAIALKLNTTLGDVNTILNPWTQLKLQAQLLGEVHYRPGLGKDFPRYDRPWLKGGVALRLHTDPTFYYGVDLLSEPRGSTTRQFVQSSGSDPSGGSFVQSTVTTDQWKVSAIIAKRLGPVGFRAGVIESTGGVGMDGYLASDHVRLVLDAFDFSNVNASFPRLRAQAQVNFLNRFFVGLGVDDILNVKPNLQAGKFLAGTDGFIAGGVTFSDDDVRGLLKAAEPKKAPAPAP